MDKKIFVKSIITRKIFMISEDKFNDYMKSEEYITINFDSQYNQYLQPGKLWSVREASHLLAGEDPKDYHWRANSGYHKSKDYQKIFDAINEDYMLGKILLQGKIDLDGKTQLMAENIIFIKLALDKKFNIPEVFKKINVKQGQTNQSTSKYNNNIENVKEVVKQDKNYFDSQLLSRKAIKITYLGGHKKLKNASWRKIFDGEKKNGLFKARVTNKINNKATYSRHLLHAWFIENGYFAPDELQRIINGSPLR